MNILKQKITLALILLFAFSFKLFAYESISFTWRGGSFVIGSTPGKLFTINWGDGSAIETITASEYNHFTNTYTNGYYLYTVTINALSNDCKFTIFSSTNNWNIGTLNSLNVANAPSLIVIECWGHKLSALDISKNTALTKLHCSHNQLKTLDVSKNIALTILECGMNQISELILGNHTKLTILSCPENSITSLDVSNCIALELLECHKNKIVELDFSKSKNISLLDCSSNNLSNLNLVNNVALTELSCGGNKLKSLDVSKNTNLEFLGCSANQITNIDVSKNLKLTIFSCGSNQLTTLDISQNNYIEQLYCRNSGIMKIEVSPIATYREAFCCYNSRLPLSELYFLSERIKYESSKWFGTQRLDRKYITPESIVDFSSQTEFGGIKTVFMVEKDGVPASENDYTLIDDGVFKFDNIGDYTITMTNDAIISYWEYPPKVIAEISVREVGVAETQHATSLHLYPNPVSNILYINLANTPTPPEVKIYSLQGVLLLQTQENQIDVSSLPAGFYVANVNGINRKIIKQL